MTTSEYTKAIVFAEAIALRGSESGAHVPTQVLEDDAVLKEKYAALARSMLEAREEGKSERISMLEPQVRQAKENLERHIEFLRTTHPSFAATMYPQPLGISQSGLKEEEWLLTYDVTDSGLIVYLVCGKRLVKALFKPIARTELNELLRKFRESLEIKEGDDVVQKLESFDLRSGRMLSEILLSDVLPEIPKDTPVIIIPDDSLGVLPYEMLVLNDRGRIASEKTIPSVKDAEFFGDRNPISYYQSITALILARTLRKNERMGSRTLVMDDPVFQPDDARLNQLAKDNRDELPARAPDTLMSIKTEIGLTFPRLPLTAELGEFIYKLDKKKTDRFTGLKAQKGVLFKRPLDRYGAIVFPTHGYAGTDLPGFQEPVLVLTLPGQPEGQDGFLRMNEALGLKLNADIVALTACQSGLGRRISGEGTMGMGRAFQYAGANAVLMSLWSVAEESSVMLVERFFKHMKDGKSKRAALQLARKEIREAGYDHPFFWAPFILVGEVD